VKRAGASKARDREKQKGARTDPSVYKNNYSVNDYV
jgi:hypothetical protein